MTGNIIIQTCQVGPVETNCYLAANTETGEAICIDPGDDGSRIAAELREHGWTLQAILLTHGHFDHILGIPELTEQAGKAPVYAARAEKDCLNRGDINLSDYNAPEACSLDADRYLEDKQELMLIGRRIVCLLTPGHTAGGMCYYLPEEGVLFSGDTLFRDSVGRTDLPTADGTALMASIRRQLLSLPEETEVYPGHGPKTAIGWEKRNNRYLR